MLTASVKADPILYNPRTFSDINYNGLEFFTMDMTNIDYGDVWIWQVNTNLTSTNWTYWGGSWAVGQGTTQQYPYTMIPYPLYLSTNAFFRMVQIGTNFEFYPGINASNFPPRWHGEFVSREINFNRQQVKAETPIQFNFILPAEIPDMLYPQNSVR